MKTADLIALYKKTRATTEELCLPLLIEDYVIQGMEDVSPPKWHLAHTSWFFETCILKQKVHYQPYNPIFQELFNSYYQLMGKPFPRPKRGLLSRPSVEEVYAYRHHIDEHVLAFMSQDILKDEPLLKLIKLGIHHEQQHQELLLMDVHYNFSLNPLFPVYQKTTPIGTSDELPALEFLELTPGVVVIGAEEQGGFHFDNEYPHHQKIITQCAIANRLISNQEYLHFIEDGGYENPGLWLSDGWDWLTNNSISKPLYWRQQDNQWWEFSLLGLHRLNQSAPVAHISFYEAEAYARWAKARLPTEEEWEHHVRSANYKSLQGNFLEEKRFSPLPASSQCVHNPHQFFGDLWEWTSSAYAPYPRYQPFKGVVGEYNGKFMNNQRVLRGGCCITPRDHIRTTYRNFFQPDKRWQFCGIRLVKE